MEDDVGGYERTMVDDMDDIDGRSPWCAVDTLLNFWTDDLNLYLTQSACTVSRFHYVPVYLCMLSLFWVPATYRTCALYEFKFDWSLTDSDTVTDTWQLNFNLRLEPLTIRTFSSLMTQLPLITIWTRIFLRYVLVIGHALGPDAPYGVYWCKTGHLDNGARQIITATFGHLVSKRAFSPLYNNISSWFILLLVRWLNVSKVL